MPWSINLWWIVSLWCELLSKLSIYTALNSFKWITNYMVSKIWVGLSATNIHLLQFKIQSYLQKWDLSNIHQNSFWKKKQQNKTKQKNISNNTFAILHFSYKNASSKLTFWVFWNLLPLMKCSECLKIVYFSLKKM